MEQFTIHTSQNVGIVHSYASVAERITAAILDYLIIGSWLVLTTLITGAFSRPILLVPLGLPVILYHLIFELLMNGQSPGKKKMGIKVISEDGTAPSFTQIFLRWVFRLIDISFSYGSVATLFIIINKKNQRIGDIVAGTVLIRTRHQIKDTSLYMSIPDDYSPGFQQAASLDEKDIRVVKEVLAFMKSTNMNEESVKYARRIKDRLQKKMNIQSDQPLEEFLRSILLDYNYYNSE